MKTYSGKKVKTVVNLFLNCNVRQQNHNQVLYDNSEASLLPFTQVYVAQASGISVGGNTPLLKNWQMLLKKVIREKTKPCFILYATARTIRSPYLLTSLMARNQFRMPML